MRLLSRLAIGLVIILVLSIGVITVTLINFDPNNYKDTIAAKVKEKTGIDLNLEIVIAE